jgi:hypothetical protein
MLQVAVKAVVLGENDRSRRYDCLNPGSECPPDVKECFLEGTQKKIFCETSGKTEHIIFRTLCGTSFS